MRGRRYNIGEIVNNFEILGINTDRRYVRYYCKCLKCGGTYLYQKFSIEHNKGNGCQVCNHRIDTNDIIGKEFDSWKVLNKLGHNNDAYKQKYLCQCKICQKTFEAFRNQITNKPHSYCQHCFREHICEYKQKCNGRTKTRIYGLWKSMKSRCYYPKDINYHNYGGRGIKVCDEWLGENGFENFKIWAYKNGYKEEILSNGRNKWTIDRIDVNGDYEPSNCRFITTQEQLNNTRFNIYYDFEGEKLTLAQICRKKQLNENTIENRINNLKWTIEEAIYTPIGEKRPSREYKWDKKQFEYNGELLSRNDICKRFNLSRSLVYKRFFKGFSVKEVIEVPFGMPINKWRKYSNKTN